MKLWIDNFCTEPVWIIPNNSLDSKNVLFSEGCFGSRRGFRRNFSYSLTAQSASNSNEKTSG